MKHLNQFTCFSTLVVAIFTLAVTPVGAQIIEEDDTYEHSDSGNFFGRLSASNSNGSSHSASYGALVLGYDKPFARDRGRFYFSGVSTSSKVELDLKLKESYREGAPLHDPDEPETITREEEGDDFDVQDAFLQYNLTNNFQFTLGRRRVSWGQFDLFSPINLALPLTPQTAEPTARKINTLVPQDQVALSLFFGERVELQGYHFFSTQLDYLIEDVISGDAMEQRFGTADTTSGNMNTLQPTESNDLEEHTQSAVRLMFYPNWGTIGFLYHKGRNVIALSAKQSTLVKREVTPNTLYTATSHADLYEAEHYGFELAIPADKWVWKFEVLRQESMTDLEGSTTSLLTANGNATDSFRDYLDAIISGNEGKLYVPVTTTLIGIGADSDRDNWRFNLSLFALQEEFEKEDEALIQLEEAAGFDSNRGDTFILPAINIARYIGGDKQKEVGFVAGFLGAYLGASLYFTSHIGDNFRYVLGVEAASNLRDQLISDTGRNANRYELADEISTGARVSFTYSF